MTDRSDDLPDDAPEMPLLEKYLADLQAGVRPDSGAVLQEHPELAAALECIEALDRMAPLVERPAKDDSPCPSPSSFSGELPRNFGPYELVREIGRGGMGVVYEARQKGLDRSVAVKMILAGHLASPEAVRRFQAEAKAAARLRHSNIVHIHDVGQFNGQDFFAMEFIEGESLARRMARGRIDVQEVVRLMSAVARAVDHLHSRKIVHRDLKPSNILLDVDGRPFVTDFGLAKIFAVGSDQTSTGVIAGTPSYMAPEQASGRRDGVGPATDVYGLGAMLYEMLTGTPPFHAETPLDTLMEVLGGDPAAPRTLDPHIPRGLELICMKCLAKDSRDRYASAAALADDLDRFARGEALAVRPPTVAQRFWSWTRRQPALASRLGAIGLFYAIETGNFWVGAVDFHFHEWISIVLGVWIAASILCQWWLNNRRRVFLACYVWGTLDSAALLTVLLLGYGAASSLVVGYPLIIVASALWFRVRFVSFITLLSMLSYGVLMIDFYSWRPGQLQEVMQGVTLDRHVIFLVSLLVLGSIVSYLVQRVRILSNFYGRPL